MSQSIANVWLESIRRKTIKNITHTQFVSEYANSRQCVNDLILILCGNRYDEKLYFVIKIYGALYEPFAGPHFVQIGNNQPFWVHSLTAFRREFFGLTDKLSFERSVFVCLSNGNVVRLKVARPYLFMHHNVLIDTSSSLKIMKTPFESFFVTLRDINKHKQELQEKKEKAIQSCQAVRTRVRNHLVSSVQQLFCSYLRDHQILPNVAKSWFHTDINFAIEQCESLFLNMVRVDDLTTQRQLYQDSTPRSHNLATVNEFQSAIDQLQVTASNIEINTTNQTSSVHPRVSQFDFVGVQLPPNFILCGIEEDVENDMTYQTDIDLN